MFRQKFKLMMKRRSFLSTTPKLVLGLGVLPYMACGEGGDAANSLVSSAFTLEEFTIDQLKTLYKNGQMTISEVVEMYIARITAIDQNGPSLNSIIELNPDAIEIAAQLDTELKAGQSRGPLHGIPVVLKDNIDTHDKMMCTAGSRALIGSHPQADSWVAAQLRAAGAIILGKANLSEWANFRSELSSSGWSGRGGQTKNPYRLDRNPCGSSAGSGAAVSANLCMLAIGTETNGSIVCPSHANGVVGIKPTVGLIGRSGIIPISETQDTAGPMARTVSDAALCLGALIGIDPRDPRTKESEGKVYKDYTVFLKEEGLKGKRIGLYKRATGFHHRVDELLEEAVALLKSKGAEVIDIEQISEQNVGGDSFQVLLYEFKDGLNKYFEGLGPDAPVRSLKELIEFNRRDSIESRFDQGLLEEAQKKGDLQSEEYIQALERMLEYTREKGLDRIMDDNKLDAIIGPTGSPAWKTDHVNGDLFLGGSSSPAARAGYPNITVPMGFVDDLPVGLSFFGKAWTEPLLLEITYAFEQASKHRKAPRFLED